MKIPCNEEDVQLLGKQVFIVFMQRLNFVEKGNCEDQRGGI
jgi:hypothetical protein